MRDLRCTSVLALAKRCGPRATRRLIEALQTRDVAVKEYAINGLAGGDDSASDLVADRLDKMACKDSHSVPSEILMAVAHLGQHVEAHAHRRIALVGLVRRHWSVRDGEEREWFGAYWPDVAPRGAPAGQVPAANQDALRTWARTDLFRPLSPRRALGRTTAALAAVSLGRCSTTRDQRVTVTEPGVRVQRHTCVVTERPYPVWLFALIVLVGACSSGGGRQSMPSTLGRPLSSVPATTTVAGTACRSAPPSYGAPAGLPDQLLAKFPASFGGLVSTDCLTSAGRLVIDLYVVGDPARIRAYVYSDGVSPHSRYSYVVRPATHSYSAALALQKEVETERAQLAKAGAHVHETGIRVDARGPRVMVLLFPDTPVAQALLRRRFGTDTLTIVNSPGFVL